MWPRLLPTLKTQKCNTIKALVPHLVPTESLQVVQDLSDQGLGQLVDL